MSICLGSRDDVCKIGAAICHLLVASEAKPESDSSRAACGSGGFLRPSRQPTPATHETRYLSAWLANVQESSLRNSRGSEHFRGREREKCQYGFNDRLGFNTGDNHGANDTLGKTITEAVPSWDPVDNRLHCLGHIIHLAVQAFLFAKDEGAIHEAGRQYQRSTRVSGEEIALAFIKSKEGWSTVRPLQKLHRFCVPLNRSACLRQCSRSSVRGVLQ